MQKSPEPNIDSTFWTRQNVALHKLRQWDGHSPDVSFRRAAIVNHVYRISVKSRGALEILDVGGGLGNTAFEIFKRHILSNVIVLDSDINALKESNAALRYFPCHFVQSDAQKLPFQSEVFDIAICSEVLEHVLDDLSTLNEISRVTKKRGVIIITIPYQEKKLADGHLRTYDLSSFSRLCKCAHLEVNEVSFRCRSLFAITNIFLRRNTSMIQGAQLCYRKTPIITKFIASILSPIDHMLAG